MNPDTRQGLATFAPSRVAGAWRCVVALGLVFGPLSARAEQRVDSAVLRATDYLISKQDMRGAILENRSNETAMTALALLAMAAVGHQPTEEGKYGDAFRKALQFVIKEDRMDKDGYFGSTDGSRMYGHGIVTLMLAELAGMGGDAAVNEVLRKRCQAGVDLILRAQSAAKAKGQEGGWRYSPKASDSDLSVTVWQLMALRAAKNSGFEVPGAAIEQAVNYIKRLHTSKIFAYQAGGRSNWATASEGLLALQVCGEYQSPEVLVTADWLLKNPPTVSDFFFYGTYYYAQGMYQRGGSHAEAAVQKVNDLLLPLQDTDGSWKSAGSGSEGSLRIYRTAMAMLSLAVKYHYLPIYQR
jgi:hypothetical protein